MEIEQNDTTFYRSTNANGDYNFFALPGDYDITLILPENNLWTACQTTQSINVPDNQPVTLDFAAQAVDDCPSMTVDIAAPFLRRCSNSTYHVHYCNQGTATAQDAYVEVTLDPFLSAVSSSIPWTTVNGQTYTFPIGDVGVGQCGDFSLTVSVSCDAVLGQTHCTEAHIFPDDICQPVNPLWDGSILDVTGTCDGDSVRFSITNIGDDMDSPVPFIVIEDDMVNFSGSPIQLNAGGSFELAVPANGATWRVEVENGQSSPFNGPTAFSLEGCGVNGDGSFSLGFVTQFPQGDPSPFTDVDCQPNVGSYDPNDKTGYPNGYCAAHYIESNQAIDYKIRFQNTGTDTAFTVVIRDTLPLSLDPATVQPGASSHVYDFELLGNGMVQFTFPNIMLPDSNVNEMASHGFVNFTASQMAGNNNGTVINNQAAIYFDFNSPVYTNIYTHTVADDFVQSAGNDGNLSVSGQVRTWFGKPVQDVEVTLAPTCPVYSDSDGNFEFLELDTADYVLFAKKPNLDKQDKVTILDVLGTRLIILLQLPNNNDYYPYQFLASELNSNLSVTTFDQVQQTKMGIGLDVGNAGEYWKFVGASYDFPYNPNAGISAPTNIHFDTLTSNVDSADFIAIKPGDVLDESLVDSASIHPHFYLVPEVLGGDSVRVAVKSNGLSQLQGLQFGLVWDENILSLQNVEEGILKSIETNQTVLGQVQLMAFGESSSNYPDSSTLFTLNFNSQASLGSSSFLSLDETLLPFQVVVENLKLAGASFESANVNLVLSTPFTEEGVSMTVVPNPVSVAQPVVVNVNARTSQQLTLELYDACGKLIKTWEKAVSSGNATFPLEMPLTRGFYFLKLLDENGAATTVKLAVK